MKACKCGCIVELQAKLVNKYINIENCGDCGNIHQDKLDLGFCFKDCDYLKSRIEVEVYKMLKTRFIVISVNYCTTDWKCEQCKQIFSASGPFHKVDSEPNYCSNCGAKITEFVDEEEE